MGFALSADGTLVAETRDLDPNRIVLHRVGEKWAVTRALDHRGLARELAFSPDGRFLAAGGEMAALSLFDLRDNGNAPARTLTVPSHLARALAFSPDSRRLAASMDERGAIGVWEFAAESGAMVLKGGAPALDLQFSPDGEFLACAELDSGTVRVWDLKTGRARSFTTRPRGSTSSVAFSPDGSTLAAADDLGSSEFWLWD